MEPNKISESTSRSMKVRTITGIILALIGIPLVILGDWFFFIAICFITVVSIWEVLQVTNKNYPILIWIITYLFTLSFVFWVFLQGDTLVASKIAGYDVDTASFYMNDIRVSTIGVAFLIGVLFLFAIISKKIDTHDVFYLFTMILFLGISMQSVLFLRFAPQEYGIYDNRYQSCLLFFYVYGGTALNDIFAYFTGILFGKHKMNERVSPKKTWEGFVGGVVFSCAITLAFALICDGCFNVPILNGIIDMEHWYYALIISLAIPMFAVLGDLMFSLIKRSFNIKDFGKIFPGHGGVLDRFDSLLITSLLTTVLITFIHYNPFGAAL